MILHPVKPEAAEGRKRMREGPVIDNRQYQKSSCDREGQVGLGSWRERVFFSQFTEGNCKVVEKVS